MTARHTVAAFGAAMILSAAAAGAADGILIAQKMTSASGTVTTHQIELERTRMRAESAGAGGHKMKIVFDGTAQLMRTIDDDAKTYTEMSKADMDKMSAQMSGAMARLQEQMKNMPPEARQRMAEAMQGRGVPGGGAAAPTEYTRVGTDKVDKWTCEGADQLFKMGSPAANGFSGLPIRTVIYRNGAPSTTTEITEASRQKFPDSIFAVPAGYLKRDLVAGRGRGRGRQ